MPNILLEQQEWQIYGCKQRAGDPLLLLSNIPLSEQYSRVQVAASMVQGRHVQDVVESKNAELMINSPTSSKTALQPHKHTLVFFIDYI